MKSSKDQGRKKKKNPQGFLYKAKHEQKKVIIDYPTIAKKWGKPELFSTGMKLLETRASRL